MNHLNQILAVLALTPGSLDERRAFIRVVNRWQTGRGETPQVIVEALDELAYTEEGRSVLETACESSDRQEWWAEYRADAVQS